MRNMCEWDDHVSNTPGLFNKAVQDDLPHDWLTAGFLQLAQGIANAVATYPLEWEEGCFDYEHCADNDASIWLPTMHKMSEKEWMMLSAKNVSPTWLESFTHETMRKVGIKKAV
jgi:hypothetical protein